MRHGKPWTIASAQLVNNLTFWLPVCCMLQVEVVDGGVMESRRHLNVRGKSATLPATTDVAQTKTGWTSALGLKQAWMRSNCRLSRWGQTGVPWALGG